MRLANTRLKDFLINEKMEYSIKEFGGKKVLIVDRNNVLIAHCYCHVKDTDPNKLTIEQAEENAESICNYLNKQVATSN